MKKYIICFFVFIIIFIIVRNNLDKNTYALTDLFEMNKSKSLIHNESEEANDKEVEYKKEIKDILYYLMEERTKIMQDVIYGKISLEEGQRFLSDIIGDPLLKTDMDYLNQVLEYPTDVEEVLSMKIGTIEYLTKRDSILNFCAEVIWEISDNEEIIESKIFYNFELSMLNKDYKLINYYINSD